LYTGVLLYRKNIMQRISTSCQSAPSISWFGG